MIKACAPGGHILLGLDATNIQKLKEGKPIHFSLDLFGMEGSCTISYGETLQAILDEWTAAGLEFPPVPSANISG